MFTLIKKKNLLKENWFHTLELKLNTQKMLNYKYGSKGCFVWLSFPYKI